MKTNLEYTPATQHFDMAAGHLPHWCFSESSREE